MIYYDIQNKLLINIKLINSVWVLNSEDLKMLKKARFARPLAKIEVCF